LRVEVDLDQPINVAPHDALIALSTYVSMTSSTPEAVSE
jgi:hypothetical protein